jgi:hypothetical protein
MATPDELYQQWQNVKDRVKAIQAARPQDYWADYPTYQAAMTEICDHLAGPIDDEANLGLAISHLLLDTPEPPSPPEPPPPVNTHLVAFAGTYPNHGWARDCYIGQDDNQKLWGPHHGIELLAPCPGRVEAYSFQTPLNLPAEGFGAEYARRRDDLFENWVCIAPLPYTGDAVSEEEIARFFELQNMFVSVFWPDTPLVARDGRLVHALWGGHCKSDIPVGRVDTGQRFLTSWDTGIRFERNGVTARAAHVHLCGSTTGALSPNGDIDGFLIAELLGLDVQDIGTVPGPDDYMTGQFIAGRHLTDWKGHEIPAIPA